MIEKDSLIVIFACVLCFLFSAWLWSMTGESRSKGRMDSRRSQNATLKPEKTTSYENEASDTPSTKDKTKYNSERLSSHRFKALSGERWVCPSCLRLSDDCTCRERSFSHQRQLFSSPGIHTPTNADESSPAKPSLVISDKNQSSNTGNASQKVEDYEKQRAAARKASRERARLEHQRRTALEERSRAEGIHRSRQNRQAWLTQNHSHQALKAREKTIQVQAENFESLAKREEMKASLLSRMEKGKLGREKLNWVINNSVQLGFNETEKADFEAALKLEDQKAGLKCSNCGNWPHSCRCPGERIW